VPRPARVSWIGDFLQAFEQPGQLAAQHRQLSCDRILARLLLLGHGGVGRARIGQRRRCTGGEPFGYLAGSKRFFLVFFFTPLFFDRLALRAPGRFAHCIGLPDKGSAHSKRR